MNCDCIKTVNSKLKGKNFEGRTIISARLKTVCLFDKDNQLETTVFNEMEITVKGITKTQIVKIFPSYCPFCGKKIEKHSEQNSIM
jgi:hypothetical protein